MKNILLLAAGLLLAGSVSAQHNLYGPLSDYDNTDFYKPKFGFEASVNVSNSLGNSNAAFNTGSLTGFTGGVNYELPVAYPLSLASAVLYSTKGYSATTPSGNFTQRTNFIDVPLLVKYKVGGSINLYAGPQVSFLTATANSFSNGFNEGNKQFFQQANVNNTNYDAVIGLGFNVSNNVDIHARYTKDLRQNAANGNIFVPGYSNQTLQVGVGFKVL